MSVSWNTWTVSVDVEENHEQRLNRAFLLWHQSHLNALPLSGTGLRQRLPAWLWLRRHHVALVLLWIAGLQLLWVALTRWVR